MERRLNQLVEDFDASDTAAAAAAVPPARSFAEVRAAAKQQFLAAEAERQLHHDLARAGIPAPGTAPQDAAHGRYFRKGKFASRIP